MQYSHLCIHADAGFLNNDTTRAIQNPVGDHHAATYRQAMHEATIFLSGCKPRLIDAPVFIAMTQILVGRPVAIGAG